MVVELAWASILPELFLAGGGFVVFCLGALWRRIPDRVLFFLSLFSVVAASVAPLGSMPATANFSTMLDVGGYARFITILICAITGTTLLFVQQYARRRKIAGDELYGLILLAALGMDLTAAGIHWLLFFLGLELLSISLYILIAVQKNQPMSLEAGVKYFIMGAVASAFLAFGIALVYALTGTMDIRSSLSAAAEPAVVSGLLIAFGLIMVGVCFKLSVAPFHLWAADVYQGAALPVTAFLATGSKVAVFAALLRFSLNMSGGVWEYWAPIVGVLAIASMVTGNITAVRQTRVKRLLAYSSIAQIGYLFMTLSAVKQGGGPALLFYLAVYAVMDMGAFGILGALSTQGGDLDDLEECKGLGYTCPWRAGILAVCLISLAGLPPTGGFTGKFFLFSAVLRANHVGMALVGIVTAIIAIFYYMKVVVFLYMRTPQETVHSRGVGISVCLGGAMVLVAVLWLGVAPSAMLNLVSRIAAFVPTSF